MGSHGPQNVTSKTIESDGWTLVKSEGWGGQPLIFMNIAFSTNLIECIIKPRNKQTTNGQTNQQTDQQHSNHTGAHTKYVCIDRNMFNVQICNSIQFYY